MPLREDNEFPNRPNHPDFWALSNIIIQNDNLAELSPLQVEQIIGEVIDINSLVYLASQRITRTKGQEATALQVAYFTDAFLIGYKFALSRIERKK